MNEELASLIVGGAFGFCAGAGATWLILTEQARGVAFLIVAMWVMFVLRVSAWPRLFP